MKAIIMYSLSKNKRCLAIGNSFEGDKFIIEHVRKPIRSVPLQMIAYGFATVFNKKMKIKKIDIDFDNYEEIYLISPVWAGKASAFMRTFLRTHPFENKKVHLIGSCDGGLSTYFDSYNDVLHESNEVIEKLTFIKGIKQ